MTRDYSYRIKQGKKFNYSLKDLGFVINEEKPDLSYNIDFVVNRMKAHINWNIPYQVILEIGNLEYGSDYIKSDQEWNDILNDIVNIVRILSSKGGEVLYIRQKHKWIAHKLIVKDIKQYVIVNPSSPLQMPWNMKKKEEASIKL